VDLQWCSRVIAVAGMQWDISTNKVGIRQIQPKSGLVENPEMKLAAANFICLSAV